ncbi:MAG: hypothetical protein ABIR17_12900 [Pseudolysinimonas sp.]|uniref:hypothetical protein n=1 Tax=Pseudolysinimonas sp. TaxID=2680009 RepID=UPI0032639C59
MSDNAERPSPFTRPGFIAAAIVIVIILVAGGIAVVSGLNSRATPHPTATETSGPIGSPVDESVCGLDGFETESTLTAAPDNEWELVGTVAAPTDPAIGPGVVADGFRSCFAHTTEGALFATVNFLALGTDSTTGPRLPDLVAAGPGRDALLEQIANAGPGGSTSDVRGQIAGFKIGAYSSSAATVDLAINFNDGRLASFPIKLTWEDGDWKIVLADDGSLPLSPAGLQSLGGYIPWGGA